MTGGMLSQEVETRRILERCKSLGVISVVGGPDATSSPQRYEMADFKVLGEAESIIGDFVEAWRSGARSGTFTAEKFTTDVTKSPIPRFDLLELKSYTNIGVQFSRGCPFICEFCDIIELFGRIPRAKTNAQMLTELQTLYDRGYRGVVDFVDDNIIGNKKALKAFLVELAAWQKSHGCPFSLSTEASLNIADDDELLSMMSACGFYQVFIGIESPNADVLNATRKKQNARRDIVASIHKIYAAGLFVFAGFIVGFDAEQSSVADEIIDLIEEAAITVAMVGLLMALPNTQLCRRLAAEGRLRDVYEEEDGLGMGGDQCIHGLNFDTLRPRSEILADYRAIIAHIYDPDVYQARILRMLKLIKPPHFPIFTSGLPGELVQLRRLAWNITVHRPAVRGMFWRIILEGLLRGPHALRPAIQPVAFYLHLGSYARDIVRLIDAKLIALTDRQVTERPLAVQNAGR